ncbi:MAG TPA: NADH-quinone oxidoreductase subunit J [Anaerolineae bacterium]|nr:NADH-quinone oxidoreductase subunit J [Anaerolineae bacterium]
MEMVVFAVLAGVAVLAGLGVVAQRNVVHSALFLLVNFACLAGLYILLNAQFLAVVQIIVYATAIVVLFLFVVMLLGMEHARETPDLRPYHAIAGAALGALLLGGVVWAFVASPAAAAIEPGIVSDVREIGAALLTDFSVPFELVSVVLLVALIGAIVLAKTRLQ